MSNRNRFEGNYMRSFMVMLLVIVFMFPVRGYASGGFDGYRVHKDIEGILNRDYEATENLGVYEVRELDRILANIRSHLNKGEVDYTGIESMDYKYMTGLRLKGDKDIDKLVYEISKISELEKYIRDNRGMVTNKGITLYGYTESGALDLLTNMRVNRLSKIESYYDSTRYKYNREVTHLMSTNSVYSNSGVYKYKATSSFKGTKERKDRIEKLVLDSINKLEVNEGVFKDVDMYMMPREVKGVNGLAFPNIRYGYGNSEIFVMGRSSNYPVESSLFTALHELGHVYHYQLDNIDSSTRTTVGLDMTSTINRGMKKIYNSYNSKGLNCAWADSPREKFADDFAVYHMKRLGKGTYKVRVREPYKKGFENFYRGLLNDKSISKRILSEKVSGEVILEYKGVEVMRSSKDQYFPSELLFSGNTNLYVDMRGLAADTLDVRRRGNVRKEKSSGGSYGERFDVRMVTTGSEYVGPYILVEVPRDSRLVKNSDISLGRTPEGARYYLGEHVRGRLKFPEYK